MPLLWKSSSYGHELVAGVSRVGPVTIPGVGTKGCDATESPPAVNRHLCGPPHVFAPATLKLSCGPVLITPATFDTTRGPFSRH
ncbi:hypothetical protein TNCV_2865351 [Trichonephila clavipes]|nr:hypothetical protein TNCV_2865351 [Trichonephila clavipes]